MALNDSQKTSFVFKKAVSAASETSTTRDFFEEPYTGRDVVLPSQVWKDAVNIPNTPSIARSAGNDGAEEAGVIRYYHERTMTAVAGASNAFYLAELIDAIPFNYGDGSSYLYGLKTAAGSTIAFGQNDWIINNAAGTLYFYAGVPSGVSAASPPKISFFKYIGEKGVGGGGGPQGVQGAQGPADGAQGFQGIQGRQGSQGIQGATGSTGAQGVQGAQGSQGSQGVQGATGAGSQGIQGSQGVQGTVGAQGSQGLSGEYAGIGAQGVQGATGTGTQGVQGATGSSGSAGAQGVQGAAGYGFQGFTGDRGGVIYTFSTSTVDSDPGSGALRFNTIFPSIISTIYIDTTDALGNDQTTWISNLTSGSNNTSYYGQLTISTASLSSGPVYVFSVNSVTAASGYYKIGVGLNSGSSTLPLNFSRLALNYSRTGNTGPQGIQGATGGAQGVQGATGAGAQGVQGVQGAQGNIQTNIPQNSQTASYTLVASDAGKHISITTGGITVPAGVFSVGDAVSIYNNSNTTQSVVAGSGATLILAGDGSTSSRTMNVYSITTILCVSSNTFVIFGAGLL